MRRADDAWAIQMCRPPKNRKTLVLIGIVCDDEIKDIIDLKLMQTKTNIVKQKQYANLSNYILIS